MRRRDGSVVEKEASEAKGRTQAAYARARHTPDDETLTVLYDTECPMCTRVVRWIQARDRRGVVDARPLQDWERLRSCGIDPLEALREIHVVSAGGEIRRGADGVVWVMGRLPGCSFVPAVYRIPGVRPLLRRLYRWVAAHRRRG